MENVKPVAPMGRASSDQSLLERVQRAVAPEPGGRFVALKAVRHSGRCGVFEGHDRRTGAPVIIKQARAHVAVDPTGRDCRDRLRGEAVLLARLASSGLAPRVVDVIEEDGHAFLVRESIAGATLRSWVTRQVEVGGVPLATGVEMAGSLVRLFEAVHRAGLVLVDVSPDNVVIDSAGALWLVDLGGAAEAGQVIYPAGTPGYAPPEHMVAGGSGIVASPDADLFGLGGLLFLVAVGTDPVLADDDPVCRPAQHRLRAWLEEAQADLPVAHRLAAPVLGLRCQQPADRWRPDRVLRFLRRPRRPAGAVRHRPDLPGVDRLIRDGIEWLQAELAPDGRRLWPAGTAGSDAAGSDAAGSDAAGSDAAGSDTDPCAVQHGAAGVLAALVAVAPYADDPDRLRDTLARICGWIQERLPAEPRLLPGLHFGRSGIAWALYDAATLLGDRQLAADALDLAARVPVDWPSLDIAHGLAGAGMAQLHLWRASGDQRFGPRVRACADALVRAARHTGPQVGWPTPSPWLTVAGDTRHGYAHGTAGIGAFLLAAGAATGDAGYTALACQAAHTLAEAAVRRAGAAMWPTGPGSDTMAGPGWCTGSAGIGTFLLRAWQVTGERRLLDLARAAAIAVHRARGWSSTTACHGLAGGGQLLLDLCAALNEPVFRCLAEDLARVMAARAVRRGGLLLVPDETGLAVVADYGVGLAGVLAFLTRLRHGGRPPWTVEPDSARTAGRLTARHHPPRSVTATAELGQTTDLAALQ